MNMVSPVALFAYKRLDKLQACIRSLEMNTLASQTILYIFCDGAKKNGDENGVKQVREYIKNYVKGNPFRKVVPIYSLNNKGLANSIISGVTQVINEYEMVIVVEDDLIVSSDFLLFMNEALCYYKNYKEYGEVSAYTYPIRGLSKCNYDIYVTRKGECWGWGTWKDRWEKVDWSVSDYPQYLKNRSEQKRFDKLEIGFDKMLKMQMEGKSDSWAIRWCYHLFVNGLLVIYPTQSKVNNLGFDGSGTHCGTTDKYNIELKKENKNYTFAKIGVDEKLEREAARYSVPSISEKIKILMRRLREKR